MKKAIKIAAVVCLLMLLADAGVYAYNQHKRAVAFQEMYDAMAVHFNDGFRTVEYGSDFKADDAVLDATGTTELINGIDTSQLGKQTILYRVSDTDEYGKSATKEFSFDVEVVDTTAPVINFYDDDIAFSEDMDFDPMVYLNDVVDPVDGELVYSDTLSKGTYTVDSNVNTEEAGEYRILITAMDNNGVESSAECKVTVLDSSYRKTYPYYIRINRVMNTVTIYSTDSDGNPDNPVKAMVCSTGGATPFGTYRTYYKQRWNGLFGNVYGQYATGIVGDILFHSVPYFSIDKGDLEYIEYNKLGTKASLGCVRLCVRDVKWVYDYCNVGTVVEFYDDEDEAGPLGKPEPITIDLDDERRGWDPTDPDPDNPWNT
ncbi:MAG: L,D-transpeptidase [Oscillospiraceae bacterium]|nr:L,D-transpeptidase [Oscillospiraceae bacterium]